jgi:serine/threonine protein kinase
VPLARGARLGPYEISGLLGAGGMGEVYRAHDTRLGRDVAVKVIPEELAVHKDRLRRFEQEARATAALNHPNILALFDVGVEGEVHYVVEELIEGETLRERLRRERLPVHEAVDQGVQIARGLAAAHERGIVHRDLKPENVFLFSLGVVRYEMLSGRRAFVKPSAVETLHAILSEDPPQLSGVGVTIPVALDRVVRRCLEKRPEARFVDETGRTEPLPGFDRPLVSPQLSFSPDGRLLAFNEQERTGLLWLFDVERQTYRALSDRGIAGSPRWSPDGKRLAVGWSEAGPMQLWLVPTERSDWERLTTEDPWVWSPSWSPDGRHFVIGKFVKTDPPPPITRLELVRNWFAELERLCPTRR